MVLRGGGFKAQVVGGTLVGGVRGRTAERSGYKEGGGGGDGEDLRRRHRHGEGGWSG